MCVAELVRRKAPTHPGLASDAAQLRAGGAGCPRPSALGPQTTQNSGPTGSSTRARRPGSSCSDAESSIPTAAPATLAAPYQQRPATRVEVGLLSTFSSPPEPRMRSNGVSPKASICPDHALSQPDGREEQVRVLTERLAAATHASAQMNRAGF
jgi:hypothetical protein